MTILHLILAASTAFLMAIMAVGALRHGVGSETGGLYAIGFIAIPFASLTSIWM